MVLAIKYMRSVKNIFILLVFVLALSGCEKYELTESCPEELDVTFRHEEVLYNDIHSLDEQSSGGIGQRGDGDRPVDDGDGITDDDDDDDDSEENQDKNGQ